MVSLSQSQGWIEGPDGWVALMVKSSDGTSSVAAVESADDPSDDQMGVRARYHAYQHTDCYRMKMQQMARELGARLESAAGDLDRVNSALSRADETAGRLFREFLDDRDRFCIKHCPIRDARERSYCDDSRVCSAVKAKGKEVFANVASIGDTVARGAAWAKEFAMDPENQQMLIMAQSIC